MAQDRRLRADALRSLAFGGIGAAFAVVGSVFSEPIRIMMLQNLTDVDVIFSFTGNTDHVIVPAGGFLLLDITTNQWEGAGWFIQAQTQMYVKQASGAPTSGSVYISAFFAAQGVINYEPIRKLL